MEAKMTSRTGQTMQQARDVAVRPVRDSARPCAPPTCGSRGVRRGAALMKALVIAAAAVLFVGAVVVVAAMLWPRSGCDGCWRPVSYQISALSHALDLYQANVGHYPTEDEGGLKALVSKPNYADPNLGEKWQGPYIKAPLLKDPWGKDIHYEVAQPGDAIAKQVPFKLWSSGPDTTDGTEDDVRNWSEPESPSK